MKKIKKIIISIVIIGGGFGLYFYFSSTPETDTTIPETKDSIVADSVVSELSPVLIDTAKKDTVLKNN